MRSVTKGLGLLTAVLLGVGGCPTTTDNTSDGKLTEQQKAAVSQVAQQTSSLAAVLGTYAGLNSTGVDFDLDGASGPFGTCPAVTLSGSAASVSAVLDFGTEGCSSRATAGQTVSGSVKLTVTRTPSALSTEFQNLQIDGHSVSGQLTATFDRSSSGLVLECTCNVTIAGIGTVTGTASVVISSGGLITISSATATMTSGTTAYVVTLTSVVLDPIHNGNFIPESGTATFEIPNARTPRATTIVVTFDSQSPVDRTVSVQVGNTAPIDYQLP